LLPDKKKPILLYTFLTSIISGMRVFLSIVLLLLIDRRSATAQTDTTALLNEIEAKLKKGSTTVSSVLTDKNYLPLHPHTAFREMLKKFAAAATLTITTPDEPGKKIKVMGFVKNGNGKPVTDALVYLYQTDARGWYAADAPHVLVNEGDIRHARLFGYVKTNNIGHFELHTVKPSGYPRSELPAHIHVHVIATGYQSYGTEFLFDDDERLVGNIRANAQRDRFMIAKPEKTNSPFEQQFSYTITLQKN
jgi:protocatechuate 3,4-dioxygenase beta subunit